MSAPRLYNKHTANVDRPDDLGSACRNPNVSNLHGCDRQPKPRLLVPIRVSELIAASTRHGHSAQPTSIQP